MTNRTAQTRAAVADRGATAEFERLYRANMDAVMAYFARRSADPHVVADLTVDTFIEELLDRIDAERARAAWPSRPRPAPWSRSAGPRPTR